MSISLCLMASSFSGSVTSTCTPMCILAFCRLKSRHAILAFVTFFVMAAMHSDTHHSETPTSPQLNQMGLQICQQLRNTSKAQSKLMRFCVRIGHAAPGNCVFRDVAPNPCVSWARIRQLDDVNFF
uniref:Putative secreted protein n=1 Tax=Ixodes ricinus TaxID=34613 RepID=A0A147BGJ9_IXORI